MEPGPGCRRVVPLGWREAEQDFWWEGEGETEAEGSSPFSKFCK